MKIINCIEKAESEIKESIIKYGYLPQHHFELFLNYGRESESCVFLDAGGKRGVFAYLNLKTKNWRILTDPISPLGENLKIISQAIDFIFKNYQPKKIILEDITEELSKKIKVVSKNKFWRALPPTYSLFWPVIDLNNLGNDLSGRKWKRLRNIRNKFLKENQVIIREVKETDKEDLKNLVTAWKKQRKGLDREHLSQYLKFIDCSFKGLDLIRVTETNGRISCISGGWSIPNSKNYYSFFGLHDYYVKNIGEVSYIDELLEAKKRGFEKVDLGGSEKNLIQFKIKFHPDFLYKTDTFSVVCRRS